MDDSLVVTITDYLVCIIAKPFNASSKTCNFVITDVGGSQLVGQIRPSQTMLNRSYLRRSNNVIKGYISRFIPTLYLHLG